MKSVLLGLALFGSLYFGTIHAAGAATAVATHTVPAIAFYGEPKYAPDFKHFDYVNPDAPKGGTVHLQQYGGYDSFNPFSPRGQAAVFTFSSEPLMAASDDERATLYGIVAQTLTYPDDYSWAEFTLKSNAHWSDGTPITAEDVVFSVEAFKKSAAASFQSCVANIAKAVAEGPRKVRFTLKGGNRSTLLIVAALPIVPKHYWKDKDFSAPLVTPPLGAGPYKVTSFDLGHSITLERVKDYWAKDLPEMRGRYNFDKIIIDYFRDQTVALEAFKAGQSDIRFEINTHEWVHGYNWPSAKQGLVKKMMLDYQGFQPAFNYFFNLRRPMFQDVRVREALGDAYDFTWIKKNVYNGQLGHPDSYFGARELAAAGHGLPSRAELKLLEPLRSEVPARVFTEPVTVPETDGTEEGLRKQLRIAAQLLKEAGYINRGGKLVNERTGEPLSFEIMQTPGWSVSTAPAENWIANLKLLGIDAKVTQLDAAQFLQRQREFDFDVELTWWTQPAPGVPGEEQRDRLGSAAADRKGSSNWVGIKNPAVDALIEDVIAAKGRDNYVAAVRALDRVLMWNFYCVGGIDGGGGGIRVGYWDRFGMPKAEPTMTASPTFDWWIDPAKDQALAIAKH